MSLSNYLAADSAATALRRDVLDGLTQTPKSLPPKWFYDSVGSDLFDQITRLPEYYPTRAEAEILRAPVGRDRRRVRCRHVGGTGQRHFGEDAHAARRAARRVDRCAGSSRSTSTRACSQAGGLGHRERVSRSRDRRGLRGFRGSPGQDPARRPPAGGVPGLDDRQSDPGPSRRVPRCARRDTLQPGDTCCWAPTWSRTPTGWCAPTTTAPGVTARFNRNVLAVVNRELRRRLRPRRVRARRAMERATRSASRCGCAPPARSGCRCGDLDLTVDFAAGEEMLTEVSCKFRPDGVDGRARRGRVCGAPTGGPTPTGTSGCRCRRNEPRRSGGGAARPTVAGVHLDSAACSRQSFAVIDAAAQHARHEAEVGGYVAAEAAAPVLDAGRAAIAALTGLADTDVVFTTGSNNALDLLLGDWSGERTLALPARRVRTEPGDHGRQRFRRPRAARRWRWPARPGRRRPRSWSMIRPRWCT